MLQVVLLCCFLMHLVVRPVIFPFETATSLLIYWVQCTTPFGYVAFPSELSATAILPAGASTCSPAFPAKAIKSLTLACHSLINYYMGMAISQALEGWAAMNRQKLRPCYSVLLNPTPFDVNNFSIFFFSVQLFVIFATRRNS